MNPCVSVIIPVHNRPGMLAEAVRSAIAQTYRPIEIIIIDDGSTDETSSVADGFDADHPEVVRTIHQENRGTGAAREAGRQAARGEFIQHLDSDDLLDPRKFERQIDALNRHPECAAAYGWTRVRFPDGSLHPEPWKRSGEHIPMMFPAMLQSRWWDTPTPLYRASWIHRAGAWLPLRVEEDWEYDCRIAALGAPLCMVDDWVCQVRQHASGHVSGKSDTSTLRDRAVAHTAIYEHARRAGIADDTPEMRYFARELFLLARQSGAAGLDQESKDLFLLARSASGADRDRPQFRIYAAMARMIGWSNAARFASLTDRLRP